jgi:hypothetical protein
MLLLAKILGTYALLSWSVGLLLMVLDAISGFNRISAKLIVTLYVPPLVLVVCGCVIAALIHIWTGELPA